MKNVKTPEQKKFQTRVFKNLLGLVSIMLLIITVVMIIFTAIFSQFEVFNLNFLISNGTFYLIVAIAFVITLVIAIFISKEFSKPLSELSEATKLVGSGNFDVKLERPKKKKKKDEIDEVYESFNKMVDELKHNEIFKTDFISNVSHEIKTPLATIQGYATLLQDSKLTKSKRDEYLNTIIDATKRLTTLTTNILKLSKLENQGIFAERKVYNVAEQIRQVVVSLESGWAAKDIELNIDLDEISLKLDEELMNQVWKNIIENAIKFSNQEGKIDISLKQQGKTVIAKISDNGIGMDDTTKKHLFDKFYQGDNSHSKEGNGLGLALTKRILDIHEAKIEVKSQLNKGSTFIITFDL